jgi:DNA-binding NtrC family response regulator
MPRELLEAFVRYDWPGNIRQLENAVKRHLILPDLEMAFAELKVNWEPRKITAAPVPVPPPAQPVHLKDLGAKASEQAEREAVEDRKHTFQFSRTGNNTAKDTTRSLATLEVGVPYTRKLAPRLESSASRDISPPARLKRRPAVRS